MKIQIDPKKSVGVLVSEIFTKGLSKDYILETVDNTVLKSKVVAIALICLQGKEAPAFAKENSLVGFLAGCTGVHFNHIHGLAERGLYIEGVKALLLEGFLPNAMGPESLTNLNSAIAIIGDSPHLIRRSLENREWFVLKDMASNEWSHIDYTTALNLV